jgi:hypothetical protein
VKHRVFGLIIIVVMLIDTSTRVGAKDVFQTTKLIELIGGTEEFCFVIQINDLAYVVVAKGHAPSNLIVGDPILVKVKDDNAWVKDESTKKFYYDRDDFKARIVSRKRMTGDTALPTCALSVKIH